MEYIKHWGIETSYFAIIYVFLIVIVFIVVRLVLLQFKNTGGVADMADTYDEDQLKMRDLEVVASEVLGVKTLKTHNNYSDFYDLPVWDIRLALQLAYESGERAGKIQANKEYRRVVEEGTHTDNVMN